MSNKVNPRKIIDDALGSAKDAVSNAVGSTKDAVTNAVTSQLDIVKNPAKAIGSAAKVLATPAIGLATGDFSLGTEPGEKISKAFVNARGSMQQAAIEGGLIDDEAKKARDAAAAREANKPPVMPTVDSEAVAKARRRQAVALRNRGGRASTILTGGSDKFGG
jgi:hypothetical protein